MTVRYSRGIRSVPKKIDQFISSSRAIPLRSSSKSEKFLKKFIGCQQLPH